MTLHHPHPATNHLGDPDLCGSAGAAWMVDLQLTAAIRPECIATLSCWQATIPKAHPFWHSYIISAVHLRSIDGAPPARKQYPAAAYELTILALDPDKPLADPKDAHAFRFSFLSPPNLVIQFHGITDGQAQGLPRALARAFVAGKMSPDTDFRPLVVDFIKKYIARFGGGVA